MFSTLCDNCLATLFESEGYIEFRFVVEPPTLQDDTELRTYCNMDCLTKHRGKK